MFSRWSSWYGLGKGIDSIIDSTTVARMGHERVNQFPSKLKSGEGSESCSCSLVPLLILFGWGPSSTCTGISLSLCRDDYRMTVASWYKKLEISVLYTIYVLRNGWSFLCVQDPEKGSKNAARLRHGWRQQQLGVGCRPRGW